jgi:hypothetical protein
MNANVTHVIVFGFRIEAAADLGIDTGRPAIGSIAAIETRMYRTTIWRRHGMTADRNGLTT